ncbi:MAG: FHA domain-containing serine/threonine-protein kinase [Nitrososphaerota archaeon]
MSGSNLEALKELISEMNEKIARSASLFQVLVLLEFYLKKLEDSGCSGSCLESAIKNADAVAKSLMRLSSCRLDLVDRVIKKDPRTVTVSKYMRVVIELLQQECGQQTYPSSPAIQEVQGISLSHHSEIPAIVKQENRLGKYEIVKLLGEGGMGVVWLAKDSSSSGLVAIKGPKIYGEPIKDELNIKRIIIEAEVLKNLDHPNIVKFIDFFTESQKPYLVMEYIEGEHLEKKGSTISMDEKQLISFVKSISEAIDHMHDRNVVHRDLKPKNIYIPSTKPWSIKILDFGTAKFFHSQLERGEAIYSPGGYTPPEQLKFMYSPQSDIWSLGGVIFYLLTKQHPIVAMPDYPVVREPPRVEKYVKDVDPRWIKVIKKAMDPDPVKRYLRASDLVKELIGEKDLSEKTVKPKLIVLGVEIPVEVERVVIGRLSQVVTSSAEKVHEKVVTMTEGNNLYVYIYDQNSYISRLHAELIYKNGSWYLRDLGSLNKTAILVGGEWKTVYNSYRVPSNLVEIGRRSMISLGYDDKLGPYLVISFLCGPEE